MFTKTVSLRITILGALFICGFCTDVFSAAPRFSVGGTVTNVEYSGSSVIYSNVMRFKVIVSDDRWWIRTELAPARNRLAQFWEAGYSGTNLFLVKHIPSDVPPGVTNKFVTTSAEIRPSTAPPPYRNAALSVLWLGYASFNTLTNSGFYTPVFRLETEQLWDSGFKLKTDIKLAEFPHLPSEVVYWNDGKARVKNKSGGLSEFDAPFPYNAGFTNAIYAGTISNHNGIYIPEQFKFTRFFVKNQGVSSNDLAVLTEVYGATESFELQPENDNLTMVPKLPAVAIQNDLRLGSESPIAARTILITGGQWQIQDIEVVKRQAQSIGKLSNKALGRKYVVLVIFAVCCTGFLVLLAKNLIRRQQATVGLNDA